MGFATPSALLRRIQSAFHLRAASVYQACVPSLCSETVCRDCAGAMCRAFVPCICAEAVCRTCVIRLCAEPVYESVCRACVPSFCAVYLAAASVRASQPHFTDNPNMRCSLAALTFFPYLSRACTWFCCRRGCRFRYGCRYHRRDCCFRPAAAFNQLNSGSKGRSRRARARPSS